MGMDERCQGYIQASLKASDRCFIGTDSNNPAPVYFTQLHFCQEPMRFSCYRCTHESYSNRRETVRTFLIPQDLRNCLLRSPLAPALADRNPHRVRGCRKAPRVQVVRTRPGVAVTWLTAARAS